MAALTVLGVGNVLMQDEGVGVRVMEALRDSRAWPAGVEFIDGGAGGLGLLNVIEQAEAMLIIDAAEMGLPPGEHRLVTLAQLAGDDPAGRVSMHDVPLTETLRLCQQFSPPARADSPPAHSASRCRLRSRPDGCRQGRI